MRASGIGRSGLFRLCCVKLGTHFAEQTLGALGEGFAIQLLAKFVDPVSYTRLTLPTSGSV